MADLLVVNSGYRIRYPHVAVATSCSTGREDGWPLNERQATQNP